MKNTHKLATAFLMLVLSAPTFAAEHVVKMLNGGSDGPMVFEPAVLSVNVGDTVKFEATDMAHNSASAKGLIPAGAKPWMGRMSQDISVVFDKEGVYVYECTPHKMMAMVGVIKVGNANNLDDIKQKAQNYKSGFVMNKDRLDNYLSQL
tara:strand:+ start:588 stop:1034 length:447 start_codon:yes stop_codon:yes gene_type:complete